MKHTMLKLASGILAPATEAEAERMKRYKNGAVYEIEMKEPRNGDFHRKVFSFLTFCFEHWVSEHDQIQNEARQFEVFRDNMTVLAGYYDSYYKLDGSVRIEAKSISYSSMDQAEFEQYYNALVNVAMRKIFLTDDQNTFNRLMSFL